ncbi:MAG: class I SAM-dependent RNA methyltransferase [Lachnospiraceae bacterium]|nr:class I SAM-dependent RNA methyltransferase [Lachnospiraceae bacterium]
MKEYILVAPCHFGLEAVLKREIQDLGYDIVQVEDGKVSFKGDAKAIPRANVFLRTAERVLVQVGRFKATTFDELFEKVKALDWEEYIPEDGKFWVKKATSIKSKLFSTTDIQRIVKKAIVEKMKMEYSVNWFEENGAEYPVRIVIHKDEVIVGLDSSGESLHMRGYRKNTAKAPIEETLAAALIMLTPWRKDRILIDPFCGSGTFAIEAAMMACNMAPGMNREFTSEEWTNFIDKKFWYDVINEANDMMDDSVETDIQAFDIDPKMVAYAKKNAELAGVDHLIHFQQRDVAELSHSKKYGFIITNPPYGERLDEKENMYSLYKCLGERYKKLDSWSAFVITSYEDAEKAMGIKATKNRKIYNGMLKAYYYQFMGPKPPKK